MTLHGGGINHRANIHNPHIMEKLAAKMKTPNKKLTKIPKTLLTLTSLP